MHKKMLIAFDANPVARIDLVEGLKLARTCGAEVMVVHVLPVIDARVLISSSPAQHDEEVRKRAAEVMAAADILAQRRQVRCTVGLGSGVDAAECIANAARARSCDLIVIGANVRTALQRFILGRVATRPVTLATVTLLICRKDNKRGAQPEKSAVSRQLDVGSTSVRHATCRGVSGSCLTPIRPVRRRLLRGEARDGGRFAAIT